MNQKKKNTRKHYEKKTKHRFENFEIGKMNCRDVRSSETAERTNGRERVDEKETKREAHDFF